MIHGGKVDMCTSKHHAIGDGFEFESVLDSQNGTNVNCSLWDLNSIDSNIGANANLLKPISIPSLLQTLFATCLMAPFHT
jgi:hypothetical protein